MKLQLSLLWVGLPATIAHPGFEYSGAENRVKGPCPGLNVLANHGLLPRDGKNVPIRDIIEQMEKVYSLTGIEGLLGNFKSVFHINENGTEVIKDFQDLWWLEADASLAHKDRYFEATGAIDNKLLDGLAAAAGGDGILSFEELADWRDWRIADSLERNPEAAFSLDSFQREFGLNSGMLFYAFGSDPLVSTVPISTIMSFLRDNRFPDETLFLAQSKEQYVQGYTAQDCIHLLCYSNSKICTNREHIQRSPKPSIIDCTEEFVGLHSIFMIMINTRTTSMQIIRSLSLRLVRSLDLPQFKSTFGLPMTLAEVGTFTGPSAIQEYIRFADESSPFLNERETVYKERPEVQGGRGARRNLHIHRLRRGPT